MYELRFEKNPFEKSQFETSNSIEASIEETDIPSIINESVGLMSHDFRDVLMKLLERDPSQRLSLAELKNHGFYEGVNWE